MAYHTPVLLNESIEGLKIKPDGIYVDLTFGGGGHSKAILSKLKNGKLFAFDVDEDAKKNSFKDKRFQFIQQNFRFFSNYIRYYNYSSVDGILADLGVSSHHFDKSERGFSFRIGDKLDMRMDKSLKKTAENVLNEYEEKELANLFKQFGELDNARKIARRVVETRKSGRINKIEQFLDILKGLYPPKLENKFLAKVFQALRIEVNNEIKNLRQMLMQIPDCLNLGGRVVIITYHSVEDREVKTFFRNGALDGPEKNELFGSIEKKLKVINKKVIVPDDIEIRNNNRARSAKLRIAERI